jgi:hypothetical protein
MNVTYNRNNLYFELDYEVDEDAMCTPTYLSIYGETGKLAMTLHIEDLQDILDELEEKVNNVDGYRIQAELRADAALQASKGK